jgi:copper chaperone CopZ
MNSRFTWVCLSLLSFVLSGCAERAEDVSERSKASAAARASTIEFNVPDMMCEDGCAMAVKDILSKQLGAKEVLVDFDAKKAVVAIDKEEFDAEQALAALVDKGFDNSSLKTVAVAETAAPDSEDVP